MRKRAILTATICGMLIGLGVAMSDQPSLTIYNQNFAVARETISLDLNAGENDVAFSDLTAHVEPTSVILRDPSGSSVLRILEQNYRADPISRGLLLSLYEGKTIDFIVKQVDGEDKIVKGKIIRSGYVPHYQAMRRYGNAYARRQMAYAHLDGGTGQPLIEVDGQLRFRMPGAPVFPELTDDTILKPTLNWVIATNQGGQLDAELCYVTGGMGWKADYNLVGPEKSDALDVIGWVTIDNQSGKRFDDARIKLMAGDVSKIQPGTKHIQNRAAWKTYGRPRGPSGPPVSEKTFDEYHLYTLRRPTTLRDRQTKQVEFVRAEGVASERIYVYDGAKIDFNRYRGYSPENIRQNRDYGTECNPKVWVMREFDNTEKNHLGIPLPAGRVRFYRRDDDGQLEFTGENEIDHTPKDEKVRVYTGNAFDLVGERRRTEYQIDARAHTLDESFEILLRNHKKEPVEVRVVENLYRWINWGITKKSATYMKTDSQTIEFRVTVPANGQTPISYTVHYTW